jgi:hypothetical protein
VSRGDGRGNGTGALLNPLYYFWNPERAATTFPAAGLLVSTFDFAVLLLVAGAVFLLASDFFSMACGFSSFI